MTPTKFVYLLAVFASFALQAGCASPTPPPSATPGIVTAHGRLQVAGHRIVGTHGRPVSLAGNSFFGASGWGDSTPPRRSRG